MRRTTCLTLFCLLGSAGALVACSSSDESGAGGAGSAGTTTVAATTSGATTTTTVSTGGTTTSQGAGGGKELLNGCDVETADDQTGDDAVIDFTDGGTEYDPACVRITLGKHLQIIPTGTTFGEHPIVGGTVKDGVATEDASGPFFAQASDPFIVPYFQAPGIYPFYCSLHYADGAMGVVYVEP